MLPYEDNHNLIQNFLFQGAFWGGTTSLVVLMWLIIGSQFHRSKFPYPRLPISTDNCTSFINATTHPGKSTLQNMLEDEDGFFLYRIAQLYYTVIALLIVVVISIIVSRITRSRHHYIKRDYLSPVIHFMLPKETHSAEYHVVELQTNKSNASI